MLVQKLGGAHAPDEVTDAIAKTVAELTSQQDGLIRQQVIEHLMHELCITTPSFAVKRRPPRSALTRGTDSGSDQLHPRMEIGWVAGGRGADRATVSSARE